MSWRAAAAAALVTAAVCFLIARGNSYQTFIIVTVGLTAIVGIGLNVLRRAQRPDFARPRGVLRDRRLRRRHPDHRARLAVLAGACRGRT